MNGQHRRIPTGVSAWQRLLGLSAILWTITLAGCEPKIEERQPAPLANVKGVVTLEGKPVSGGEINFVSPDLGGGSGLIQSDGTFEIAGEIESGEYTVAANPFGEPGKEAGTEIPQRVRSPSLSPVKVTISPGANDLSIELKQ